MYYEVHLTTAPFAANDLKTFEELCQEAQCRFTMIELSKGEQKVQPMATFICFDPYARLLEQIIRLNYFFQQKGFPINRAKIQCPFEYHSEITEANFVYFQAHVKVIFDADRLQLLKEIGLKWKAHVSVNSLAGRPNEKFLTYRQYEQNPQKFSEIVDNLAEELQKHGFTVKKVIKEVAIYDSNERVDKGWLE